MKFTHKKLIPLILTAIFILAGVLGGNNSAKAALGGLVSDNSSFGWWSNTVWSTVAGTGADLYDTFRHPFSENAFSRDLAETTDFLSAEASDIAAGRSFSEMNADVWRMLTDDFGLTESDLSIVEGMEHDINYQNRLFDQMKAEALAAGDVAKARAIDEVKAQANKETGQTEGDIASNKDKGGANIFYIIANIFAWLLYMLVWGLGWIVSKEVDVLLTIMSYPIDLSITAVTNGWAIVRDVFNNFFIVILLAIAIGTILRVPSYRYKDALPKLLIAAVLVNFSKMICGIFIDVSQILMLSFAAPLVTIQGNNIILAALGLPGLFQLMDTQSFSQTNPLGVGNVIVAMLWGVIVGLVAMVVIACIVIILVYRIVILLFLAILSPLPFFASSFDKLKSYGSKWVDSFTKYLIVGPMMLFFLWISFTIMGFNSQIAQRNIGVEGANVSAGLGVSSKATAAAGTGATAAQETPEEQILSKAMTTTGMINFSFVVVLLVMSLVMAQSIGGAGAGVARTGLGFLNQQRKRITTGAYDRTTGSRLGSAISRVGRMPVISALGGGALANYFDSQRAKVQETKAKKEQGRISNIAKAGGFNQMSESQLMKMANDVNRNTRLAAIQTLSNKGMLKDDPSLTPTQRKQRIKMINRAREDFAASMPEFLESFDNNIRKYSPGFALDTIYRDARGNVDQKKLMEDITTGKIDAGKILASASSENAKALNEMMGANSLERIQFLYKIFDGNAKKIGEAIGGIDDEQIKKTFFGGLSAHAADVQKFAVKDEIDTATGKRTGKKVVDHDKINSMLSGLVSNGIDVGEVSNYYKGITTANAAVASGRALTAAEEREQLEARKAMKKHYDSNADNYKDILDGHMESKDPAREAQAKAQLKSFFAEIGDIANEGTIEKIRSGGKNLKKALDEAINDSIIDRGKNMHAQIVAHGAGSAEHKEAEAQLKNATERAVNGGASIDLGRIESELASHALGSGGVGTNSADRVVTSKIAESKLENLNKLRFDKTNPAAKSRVGQLMWNQLDTATLVKVFEDPKNRDLIDAIKSEQTWGRTMDPAKHAAVARFL